MALAEGVRALHDDEEGTAAVEFVVLLPVYLLLITGLFAISFMTAARQALPIVARYEVWAGGLPASEIQEIMGYNGTYEVTTPAGEASSQQPLSYDKVLNDLRKQSRHVAMAKAILTNDLGGKSAPPFERRTITVHFSYSGLKVLGQEGDIGFETDAATYVALPHARQLHEPGKQEHFVEADGFRPSNVSADKIPSVERNRYLPAKFRNFQNVGPSPGRDPGIWDIHARIGGDEETERSRTQQWKTNR